MESARQMIQDTYDKYGKIFDDICDYFKLYYGDEFVCIEKGVLSDEIIKVIENHISNYSGSELQTTNIIYEGLKNSIHHTIKIKWPSLDITNENGNSININDLFCIINILFTGQLTDIKFVKSTYSFMQFIKGYVHSHLPRISTYRYRNDGCYDEMIKDFKEYRHFCYGNGPIRNTISKLTSYFGNNTDSIVELYILLCREIDVIVRIESLTGGPYIRMSEITSSDSKYAFLGEAGYLDNEHLYKFVEYVLKNSDFKYVFNGQMYDITDSFSDFAIKITSEFFKFTEEYPDVFNDVNEIQSMFTKVEQSNGCLYDIIDDFNIVSIENLIDRLNRNNIKIIDFNGQEYCLKINKEIDTNKPALKILKSLIISYIYQLIITIINSNTNGYKQPECSEEDSKSEDGRKCVGIKI